MNERKNYLDNIRVICILLVVLYHVICVFNSAGSVIHYNAEGIPAFDNVGYAVYPWFMSILFVVAGASAKMSIQKRGVRGFVAQRTKSLLVPLLVSMLTISPAAMLFSVSSQNSWADFEQVPKPVVFVIFVLAGAAHLWFIAQLYLTSLAALVVRACDRKGRLEKLGERAGGVVLIALALPLFVLAQFGNFIEVMRFPLYFAMYLLGYYVFSSEKVLERLKSIRLPLAVCALVLLPIQAYFSFGVSFSVCVNYPLPHLYAWVAILAIFAFYDKLNFKNKVFAYLKNRSFSIYLFHYIPTVAAAYFAAEYMNLPIWLDYIVTLVLAVAATLAVTEVLCRVPGLRSLYGIKIKKQK